MMQLISQLLISNNIEKSILALEALRTTQNIVKIVKEDRFLVEDAKEVIEKAYFASEEMTVIILAAKVFSDVVQNKLLKIIEEPPKNKSFILLTETKSTILETIRSRLPVYTLLYDEEVKPLTLDISALSLATVYAFVQEHTRTESQEMKRLVQMISKEAMHSGKYRLDEKSLTLFAQCFQALDMGSPPSFVLNTLLLKLLARKK